jgi:hypothetical protein
MKRFILVTWFFAIFACLTANSQATRDIKVIKSKEEDQYTNIPIISKTFSGATTPQEAGVLKNECQDWVYSLIRNFEDDKVYTRYCVAYTDPILREYSFVGKIVLKSW